MGLIPPDKTQCQAEKPNGANAFTLGGRPELIRCRKKPSVIVSEKVPASDGQQGSMALCADCLDVFNKQPGTPDVTVEVIR